MPDGIKDQAALLGKLGITALNPMQEAAQTAIAGKSEVVLLSPTGTGKTLAFLLPIMAQLDTELRQVQALVLVPSRELAIQIEQVTRDMGSGFKANAVYGGRAFPKDVLDLQHPPAILIGTPGRVADHLKRGTLDASDISILVLDEFDKSLEVGFAKDMQAILFALPPLKKKVLTSATQKVEIPEFVGLRKPVYLDFAGGEKLPLQFKSVPTTRDGQPEALVALLRSLGDQRGILFCSLKDTLSQVSEFLSQNGVEHACFFGGMEQQDRERSLIKFRNGTHRVLLATDLAARGIDVPLLDFIIHVELPYKEDEFVHRNGRTARMKSEGTIYLFPFTGETLPSFVPRAESVSLPKGQQTPPLAWDTLFISGGRKDKISKGDIAGLFFKQGKLKKDELGVIELKQDCAFVSVPRTLAGNLVRELDNTRLKKKKVRVRLLD